MSRRQVVSWLVGLLLVGVMLPPASAGFIEEFPDYVTMAYLIGGGSITVGDKIFEDWEYDASSYIPPGGSVQNPPPEAIKVHYGMKPNGDVCLQYRGGFSVIGGGVLDAFWTYKVRTLSGAPLIHDWSMSLIAFGVSEGGSILWSETLYGSPPPQDLITSGAVSHIFPYNTFKEVLDDSYSQIWVVKNLSLSSVGGNPGSSAHVSAMDQTWSQVPEASSFALFGLGVVGMGLFRRFRKR